jgi:glycosyltransferase involved in cell wall biosynthesis
MENINSLNKFKVIHVITSPCGGGAELLVRELTRRMIGLGVNCKAVYFNYSSECAKKLEFFDNELNLNVNYRNPLAIIKLRKLFKSELSESSSLIVHAHLTWPMFFVPLASLGLPVKLIFTEHDTLNRRRNYAFLKYIERIFYNRYASLIAISEGVKDSLQDWIDFSLSNKISTVLNGSRIFSFKERRPLGKYIKFISVGSLIPKKGFDRTIKALSQLENIDWQYEIIGEGSSRRELERLIASLGLQDKVILSGWSSMLEEKYHNADIMLMPSRFEGFGLVAIEGMSTGLPVIASDIDGLNEVVTDSVDSCFLVKNSNDNSEWVNKIKLCINALEKDWVYIGKESYQHSQKFSLEKMTKDYIDLYRQVLKTKMLEEDRPLVSVITSLYDAEKYIEETVKSVINQTYKNWEMIIVDDCSSDSSRDIVRRLKGKDNRIKLIESKTNFGGPARPRNIGLENAKGKCIAFLDSDDVWLANKLEKQIEFMKDNDCDIAHALVNIIDENGEAKGLSKDFRVFNKLKYIMNNKNILFYTNFININTVMMKNSNNLRFTEDKNLIALEDWFFWIEAQKSLKITLQKKILLNYRVLNNSISQRELDLGYRKGLYMLSFLLLNKNISLFHYAMSSLFNIVRIIAKKFGVM